MVCFLNVLQVMTLRHTFVGDFFLKQGGFKCRVKGMEFVPDF